MSITPSAIIKTEKLTKTFGPLTAVKDLDLEVLKGDVFGFLGQNGSGKTTTIRMLLGLIRPTAGAVYLFGMNTSTHLTDALSRLGAIVEAPVFYPYLSGIDNLRVIAAASQMKSGRVNQPTIDRVLDVIDLQRQARDPYRTYSLGMKQRLAIGATLLTDPELLMLDEPTNGLDPVGVHEMRQLILRLAEQGKTVFISSHLLYEVQQVCNRVGILRRGHLIQQGYVQELLHENEQLLVRLSSAEETGKALTVLQQAQQRQASWITAIQQETNEHQQPVLRVVAPVTRAAEITALLARQQLFVAELSPFQTSLENYFLELTESETGTGSPRMATQTGSRK